MGAMKLGHPDLPLRAICRKQSWLTASSSHAYRATVVSRQGHTFPRLFPAITEHDRYIRTGTFLPDGQDNFCTKTFFKVKNWWMSERFLGTKGKYCIILLWLVFLHTMFCNKNSGLPICLKNVWPYSLIFMFVLQTLFDSVCRWPEGRHVYKGDWKETEGGEIEKQLVD